jgi:hypothetical protein
MQCAYVVSGPTRTKHLEWFLTTCPRISFLNKIKTFKILRM